MTKKYRAEKENILAPQYQDKGILPICETFDRDSFQALFNETDCTYIRIYLGMGEDMNVRVLAVGRQFITLRIKLVQIILAMHRVIALY